MYNNYDLLSQLFISFTFLFFYMPFLLHASFLLRVVHFFYITFLLHYNMNIKERTYNVLWLQMFLEEEQEEEEGTSSEEEDNNILQAALIRRLNARYLRPRLYNVVKSKDWWQNVLPF